MPMTIKSSAFANQSRLPRHYTGDGEDVSPPLSWSDIPKGTKELALVVDDPDAPTAEPWVHWLVYGIPPEAGALPEGLPDGGKLSEPSGALQGVNSWGEVGCRGPAPPKGHGVHHYHFKLFALDAPLPVGPGAKKNVLLANMQGHVLGEADLVGTYDR